MNPKSLLAILAFMFLPIMTSCSSDEKYFDKKNPVTITLWHYYQGDSLKSIDSSILDFNSTVGIDKGIVVESRSFGEIKELENQILVSANSGSDGAPLANVFSAYADTAYAVHNLEMLADIGQYLSVPDMNAFVPEFLEDCYFNDKLMLLPIVKSTDLLYLNYTDFMKFAPQYDLSVQDLSTWEGITYVAERYYDWSGGAALFSVDSLPNFVIVANMQLGIEIMSPQEDGSGVVTLDKKVLKRIWDFYFNGRMLGYVGGYGRFGADDLRTGDILCYVGSSSGASYLPEAVIKDNKSHSIEIMPLNYPSFIGTSPISIQQGAGMAVKNDTPAAEAASVKFLQWFTEENINAEFAIGSKYLPVKSETLLGEPFTEILNGIDDGSPLGSAIFKVYNISLNNILDGNTYAMKQFDRSFDIRRLISQSLEDEADKYIETASQKRDKLERQALLNDLKSEDLFEGWIYNICTSLNEMNVKYRILSYTQDGKLLP